MGVAGCFGQSRGRMSRQQPVVEAHPSRALGPPFGVFACVGTSFSTWARNAPAFAIVSAACQAPVILVLRFGRSAFGTSDWGSLEFAVVSTLLSLLSWNLSLGALTYGVLEQLRGRRAPIGRCLGVAFQTLPRLFGISFRMALHLTLFGGPIVFVVAGLSALLPLSAGESDFEFLTVGRVVFLAVTLGLALLGYLACFAMSGPVAVVEGLDHWFAMDRSRRLSFGRRSAVSATLFLIAAAPVAFSIWLTTFARHLGGVPQAPEAWTWVGAAFDVLVVGPLVGAAVATIYRDLRRERDGVDADELAGVFE